MKAKCQLNKNKIILLKVFCFLFFVGKPRLSLTKQKFATKVSHNANPNCHRKEAYKGPQQAIKNNKILQSIIRKA